MAVSTGPDLRGPIYKRLWNEAVEKAWQEAVARLRRETFYPTYAILIAALNECEEKRK